MKADPDVKRGLLKVFGVRDLALLDHDERSRERYRRIGVTTATSMLTRAIVLGTGLVSLPLTIRYLGVEQYGLWVTISSFTAFLSVADLGLGQGLVNGLSAAHGREDRDEAQRLVASAFFMLLVIAGALGVLFAVVHPAISWSGVFNVSTARAGAAADDAVAVLVAVSLAGLPVSLAGRIRHGFQEGFVANFWGAVGSVASLTGLLVVIWVEASLPWLVLSIAAGPVLASALNGVSILAERPWLAPRRRRVSRIATRRLVKLGLLFFVVYVAGVGSFQADNLVIARILGAEAVTQFAVPMKLFMFVPLVIGFGLQPLWPAYREALAREDLSWFSKALRRSFRYSAILGVAASAVLVLVAAPLIRVWAGSEVDPSTSLLVALGVYSALFTVTTAQAMYFFATEELRFLAAVALVGLAVNLGFSIALTRTIGVPGPAWGSVIALGTAFVVQGLYIRRATRAGVSAVAVGASAHEDRIDLQ